MKEVQQNNQKPNDQKSSEEKAEKPSVDQILQTIRGVMNSSSTSQEAEEDVLELTEVAPPTKGDTKEDASKEAPNSETPINSGTNPKAEASTPAESKPLTDTPPLGPKAEASSTPKNTVSPAASQGVTPSESSNNSNSESSNLKEESFTNGSFSAMSNSDIDSLISKKVADKIHDSLTSILRHQSEKTKKTSLEDMIIDTIKPFLSDWLNKNLPNIVTMIVEREIKKLISDEYKNNI